MSFSDEVQLFHTKFLETEPGPFAWLHDQMRNNGVTTVGWGLLCVGDEVVIKYDLGPKAMFFSEHAERTTMAIGNLFKAEFNKDVCFTTIVATVKDTPGHQLLGIPTNDDDSLPPVYKLETNRLQVTLFPDPIEIHSQVDIDADGYVRFRGAENGFVGEHAVVIEGEHALSWACHEEGMP